MAAGIGRAAVVICSTERTTPENHEVSGQAGGIALSEIVVKLVKSRRDKMDFIKFQWHIYKNDPFWIPPLIMDMKDTLNPRKNALMNLGPYAYFLAYKDGELAGRIGTGADDRLNAAKNRREGYVTLFECVSDFEVAKALFDTALNWLREQGYDSVTGPQSPTNGDDYRGLLIKGYGSQPVLMDSYNPPYYVEFFDQYGFEKQFDRLAFYYDLRGEIPARRIKAMNYAMKRYGFHCDKVDIKRLKDEMRDVKTVIDESMPEWPDMIPPSWDEVEKEADKLLQVIDPDLVWFARTDDTNRPIGFAVALPDYNLIFKRINGRLFPTGLFKLLWYKKRLAGARSLILFVSPDWQKKGVSGAILLSAFIAAKEKGYVYGEGGTVHEFNANMVREALGYGGDQYKTYRIYIKDLKKNGEEAAQSEEVS